MREYYNYLHRQLYVMDTYATPHNRMINHTMAAIHSYLSAAFVAAAVAGMDNMCSMLCVLTTSGHVMYSNLQ